MKRPDFFDFLNRSLSCIAAQEPEAHRALTAAMGTMRARLVADGVTRFIRFDFPHWTIYDPAGDTDLEVAFDADVIEDLIRGELTIEGAIDRDRLRLRGAVQTVERFHGALLIYLEGLIRIPEAPGMLEDYRNT